MISIDKYEETDHPELVEFEGETLGDTLTNLITEVKRLREAIADVATNMEAADPSYLQGFIKDLLEVIE